MIQCDETRPVCSKCKSRYIGIQECSYVDGSHRDYKKLRKSKPQIAKVGKAGSMAARRIAKNAASPSLFAAPISWLTSFSESGPPRSMEMRLMHHYTTIVCHEMPNCSANQLGRTMWHDNMPQIGFDHSIVLDALLALWALHLQSFKPSDS